MQLFTYQKVKVILEAASNYTKLKINTDENLLLKKILKRKKAQPQKNVNKMKKLTTSTTNLKAQATFALLLTTITM